MDLDLFKKSLASKQKLLKEESSDERNANKALDNANKFLDKAEDALVEVSEYLVDFIHFSDMAKSFAPRERQQMMDALKELKALQAQLSKTANKIPVAP
jgi:hypothetical protein